MESKKLNLRMLDKRLALNEAAVSDIQHGFAANEDKISDLKQEFVDLVGRVELVEDRTDNHANEFRKGIAGVTDRLEGLQKSMEKIGHDFAKELKTIGGEFTGKLDDVVVAVNGLRVTEGRVDGMLSVLKPIALVLFGAAVTYFVKG